MERDDLIVNDQYSLDGHHDEETGRKLRKTIWKVALLLTVITAVEVCMGIYIKRSADTLWMITKWSFIILTLFKAGYIVMSFMHLGDEAKPLFYSIIVPLIFLIWLVIALVKEGSDIFLMRW